jgi:hydrogenase maturation protease
MIRLLILGYGNPLRGDDGFGWHAACRLLDAIADPDVKVMALQQLTPELTEPVSRSERVIFIDAAAEGVPGQIAERDVEPDPESAALTHHSTPGGLLAGARALFGRCPHATLYSVPGEDFAFGEHLSHPVSSALDHVVSRIVSTADLQVRAGAPAPGCRQPQPEW